MSITLGFLIDRLIITQLKNYYADTDAKKASTTQQVANLSEEIDAYLSLVMSGGAQKLTFEQNKVYTQHTTEVGDPTPDMEFSTLVSKLVEANHRMWKNQELVYHFAEVPEADRVDVMNRCCTLNIERNKFMDAIDAWFSKKMQYLTARCKSPCKTPGGCDCG